jgi:hypothetical protein
MFRNVSTEVLQIEFSTKANIKNIQPEGTHYKGVIGKHYSVLKSFMIRKDINGPSWMKIKGVNAENDSENPANFVIFRLDNEGPISPMVNQNIPSISVLSMHVQKFKGRVCAIGLSKAFIFLIISKFKTSFQNII